MSNTVDQKEALIFNFWSLNWWKLWLWHFQNMFCNVHEPHDLGPLNQFSPTTVVGVELLFQVTCLLASRTITVGTRQCSFLLLIIILIVHHTWRLFNWDPPLQCIIWLLSAYSMTTGAFDKVLLHLKFFLGTNLPGKGFKGCAWPTPLFKVFVYWIWTTEVWLRSRVCKALYFRDILEGTNLLFGGGDGGSNHTLANLREEKARVIMRICTCNAKLVDH